MEEAPFVEVFQAFERVFTMEEYRYHEQQKFYHIATKGVFRNIPHLCSAQVILMVFMSFLEQKTPYRIPNQVIHYLKTYAFILRFKISRGCPGPQIRASNYLVYNKPI